MFSQNTEQKKLDWMYKGPNSTVDREEYLLGRSVDKTLEELNAKEKKAINPIKQPKNHVEHECIPPSIRDFKKTQLGEQVDLAQKLQEDPLVAIKKREEETRQRLLQNPVQLKRIQKIIKKNNGKKDSDDLTAALLEKYIKLKNMASNISPEDNLDRIIAKKIILLMEKFSKVDFDTILDMFSDTESTDSETKTKKRKYYSNKKRYKTNVRNVHKRVYNSRHNKKYIDPENDLQRQRRHRIKCKRKYSEAQSSSGKRNSKYKREKESSSSTSDSSNEESKDRGNVNYGLVRSDEKKIRQDRHNKKSQDNSSKVRTSKHVTETKMEQKHARKTFSEEELEKRRNQMMQNAQWRDSERVRNIRKYRQEDRQEELKNSQDYNTDFLQKELRKSASSSTVESRIKSNINNIQRSARHMNTHFSRR